jgi:hypothetical protein
MVPSSLTSLSCAVSHRMEEGRTGLHVVTSTRSLAMSTMGRRRVHASEPPAVRTEEVQSGWVGSDVDVVARAERELGTGYGNHPSAIGPDMHDLHSPE